METLEVGILALPDFSNLTLASMVEPLRAANRAAGRALYRHRLLSLDGGPVTSSSGLRVEADLSIAAARPTAGGGPGGGLDMLFMVASYRVRDYAGPVLLDWLRRLSPRLRGLAGMESGPYLLAAAGLLDGYRATTHWEDLEDFAGRFPAIDVVNERFVVDRDRATTSGAIPTLDFLLNLIRHQHGLLLALEVGSAFIYEQDTAAAGPQHLVSLGPLRWLEPKLTAAVDLMEARLEDPLPLAEIARRTGGGERALQRLFRKRLGHSPQEVYLSIRLNAARRLLSQTELPVAEVAEACGFGSRVSFHRAFKRAFRQAPSAFRQGGSQVLDAEMPFRP